MSRHLLCGQAQYFEFLLLYDSQCAMCCSFLRLLDTCIDSCLASVDVCASASHYASINTNFQKLKSNDDLIYLDQKVKNTIVIIDLRNGDVKERSAAILSLLSCSKSPLLRTLSHIKYFPSYISDMIYDMIARNRLRISTMMGFKRICTYSFHTLRIHALQQE